jgi:hypothetical protein
MKSTTSHSLGLSAVAATIILFTFSGCCPRKTGPITSEEFLTASKAAGVDVRADQVFAISRDAESVITAPTTAWAQIPATELPKGVTFAFAHLSTLEPKVPAGYYTFKAFADDIRVGTVDARVQLIDRAGKVAAELPTQIEIHSLTVPAESRISYVTTSNPAARESAGDRVTYWYRCSNGQCVPVSMFVAQRLH